MPCHEIVAPDGTVIGHLCRPEGETKPVLHRRKKRFWCFSCRKRVLHTRMGFYPGPESYYGPTFWWECPTCRQEHIYFPGCEPEFD
jgi:hypothetical protein